LATRDRGHVEVDAGTGARRHLAGRAGEPGRAHVLNADERVALHHFEAHLEEQLLHERIADLHRRTLFRPLLIDLGASHGRALDALATALRAAVVDRVAEAFGPPLDDVARPGTATRKRLHERILREPPVKGSLAADGGKADAVPVAADAGDDAR